MGGWGLEKRNIMVLVWESYKQQILWLKLNLEMLNSGLNNLGNYNIYLSI